MFGNLPKVTIGRINAIPIRLDATFVIIPLFLFNALAGRPIAEHWPQFAAVTIGLFLSILLHELGHALTARFYRVGVVQIVVGGLYGYAQLKARSIPRIYAIGILAAGPLANLVIFLALWLALSTPSLAAVSTGGLRWPQGETLAWLPETMRILAFINLVMFVFNLFPIFPLDGGKIFGLVLNRMIPAKTSLLIVSVLSIIAGAAMVLYGFGASFVLTVIGIMIVMTNLPRFRGAW